MHLPKFPRGGHRKGHPQLASRRPAPGVPSKRLQSTFALQKNKPSSLTDTPCCLLMTITRRARFCACPTEVIHASPRGKRICHSNAPPRPQGNKLLRRASVRAFASGAQLLLKCSPRKKTPTSAEKSSKAPCSGLQKRASTSSCPAVEKGILPCHPFHALPAPSERGQSTLQSRLSSRTAPSLTTLSQHSTPSGSDTKTRKPQSKSIS